MKIIACITMLVDHIGAVFFPGSGIRIIGRVSFPIYCYLLTEGVHYTSNQRCYGRRLLTGVILAEIPFDLLFFGAWYWGKQSVMLTLFVGYLFCVMASRLSNPAGGVLLLIPFVWLGELLRVDYGGWGVMMIGMFCLTRELPGCRLYQTVLLLILCGMMSKAVISVGAMVIPLQIFAVLAMVPICLYDGRKTIAAKWVRRGFYLFYPAHLLGLYVLRRF